MMKKLVDVYSNTWNDYAIQLHYKRSTFVLELTELSENNQTLLKSHPSDEFSLEGTAFLIGGKITDVDIRFKKTDQPIRLKTHQVLPMDFITYHYGEGGFINVQRNGFFVYCAPTGQGKTYFALKNLVALSKQCDIILYINFELSVDDIKNRCTNMNIDIPSNVYIAPLNNVTAIESWVEGRGKACFIIDNIDNLVGGGLDPYGEQLEFIKRLDRFLKDENHHGLVLTQLVKENNMQILGKDGLINDSITTNILSGVKQLSYLSRSVMMTAFSSPLQKYDYKVLKMGSGSVNK